MALTTAAALAAVLLGILMAAFGLAPAALAAGVVLLAIALLRRRAVLPLAIVTAALVLPAAAVTLAQPPIDRSAGVLTVTPTRADEIDGRTFRRGTGSVLIDLRRMRIEPGRTVQVRARSDLGRVIVALPRDRCMNLRVRSRLEPRAVGGAVRAALRMGGFMVDDLDVPLLPDQFDAIPNVGGYAHADLVAFGRSVTPDGAAGVSDYRRDHPDARGTIVLDLVGAHTNVVRDYPDWVGPLTGPQDWGDQVGDVNWPASVRLPPSPGELAWSDRWARGSTSATRAAAFAWRTWPTIAGAFAMPSSVACATWGDGSRSTAATRARRSNWICRRGWRRMVIRDDAGAAGIGTPTVVLVDDHALFRAGVRAELTGRVEIVGEAGSVAEAVPMILETRPDVVLLDVHMPGGGGLEIVQSVLEHRPEQRFLALTVSDAPSDVIALIRAGARGYIEKSISTDDLAAAVALVATGEPVFSPRLAGFVLEAFSGRAPVGAVDPEVEQLTPREREVLRHIARGYAYKQIAHNLHISPRTVETHVSLVLRKLQLSGRHELARWATTRGLDG